MKYPNDEFYVEVKDKRYLIHATEIIKKKLRDELKSLRAQYQVQNNTQIGKYQKSFYSDNNELISKNYAKSRQPINQQPKFKAPDCQNVGIIIGWNLIKGGSEKIVNILLIGKKFKLIRKFLEEIIKFQLVCHTLIKRLEKFYILWLILQINQQKR